MNDEQQQVEANEIADKLLAILNKHPMNLGTSAMLRIIINSWQLSGFSKKDLIKEITTAWEFYSDK